MKSVVQVKLLPDAATVEALRETLKLCNRAAGHASRRAHATGVKGKTALQRTPRSRSMTGRCRGGSRNGP